MHVSAPVLVLGLAGPAFGISACLYGAWDRRRDGWRGGSGVMLGVAVVGIALVVFALTRR